MSLPDSSNDLSADLEVWPSKVPEVDLEQDDDMLALTASWPPRSWYIELNWKLGSFSKVLVATCSFGLAAKRTERHLDKTDTSLQTHKSPILFTWKTRIASLQTFSTVTLGEIVADEGDQNPCDGCEDGIVVYGFQARDLQAHHMSKAAWPACHTIKDLAQQLELDQKGEICK